MNRRSVLAAIAWTACAPVAALAEPPRPVHVQDAWARATPPHASTGIVYMTLTSLDGDRLIGAESSSAVRVSVHAMSMDGSIMRMRQIDGGLDLPPGKPVMFAPGGYHFMLEGLKHPLNLGEVVLVHLTFQKAEPLDIKAQVRPMGATSSGQAGQAGMARMTMGR